MKKIREIRKGLYSNAKEVSINEYGVDLDNWRAEPYTSLKARFYMEASSVLVWLLLKTKIKPNTVTIFYGLAGIIGCVLLSIPYKWTIIVALFIFFTKGILDWTDGQLARETKQTSLAGHMLDAYGAQLGALGLQIGLGFYVAQKVDFMPFFYLVPLIPFFYTASLTSFCYSPLFDQISKESLKIQNEKNLQKEKNGENNGADDIRSDRWKRYLWINHVLDDRARSVDFILLLILIEIIYPSFFVTWIVFLLLVFKRFLIFSGKFYLVAYKGWVERTLETKLNEILSGKS